jgi:hypothetical protein
MAEVCHDWRDYKLSRQFGKLEQQATLDLYINKVDIVTDAV